MTNKQRSHSPRTKQESLPHGPSVPVPVVGVGASAGGLEALELFLSHVPAGCGLAFVVIQHLDPNYKGLMVELLQNVTAMPVVQIHDGLKVAGGHVYVIPPNSDVALRKGVLHLLEPAAPRGLRLPIDFFFRSLAQDRGDCSLGVILSGMGADGTLGLRAIKEQAGGVFVQSPETAQFDSMPRSAIDAGLADVVARAEELPEKIIAFLKHVPGPGQNRARTATQGEANNLEKILLLLHTQTGQDFSSYKKQTLCRRIERRMGLHQLSKLSDYARYLTENPEETRLLFKELLIGVTQFFRDPELWEKLGSEVLPSLLAGAPKGGVFRAWVPACSTGEEAYSLAMVFCETVARLHPDVRYSLQIFGTDLDGDAIGRARAGIYPLSIAADVSEARLGKFFIQEDGRYRVAPSIRDMVIFAQQNLAMDPPFTKLDLLSCRNFLIYVEADLQKKLLALFHYSLKPGGILILGNAETIGESVSLFAAFPGRTRLYRRRADSLRTELSSLTTTFARARPRDDEGFVRGDVAGGRRPLNLQESFDALLLRHFCPAAVLTTPEGDILYISGKTGRYLEPAAGKANLNVFAMARGGAGGVLNVLYGKAVRERAPQTAKALAVENEGNTSFADITVQMLEDPPALQGMVLVVFAGVAAPLVQGQVAGGEEGATEQGVGFANVINELKHCRDQLQVTREEMQSSQEELKSANEELQSTNEELQSTNEELTTSKEEMQSINEELHTLNAELQAKVDELSHASDDMKNLLNSTDIATLFLDDQLRVRRYTERMTDIVKLIPSDVGRPITDLVTELEYSALPDDTREVLRSLIFKEVVVPCRDGRWLAARIMPYRTHDNRIDGAVITFVDVTQSKLQEQVLQEALDVLQVQFDEQAGELERAYKLELKLKNAQSILEARLASLKI